jgi:hypothetical protein
VILSSVSGPGIWVSPQIEIACREMVLPRGLHRNRVCSGVTVVLDRGAGKHKARQSNK